MRYFTCRTYEGRLYVIAEGIGWRDDEGSMHEPDELAGSGEVRAEEELVATSVGRRALRRWRGGDDAELDAARDRLAEQLRSADRAETAALAAMSLPERREHIRAELRRAGWPAQEIDESADRAARAWGPPHLSPVE